MNRIGGDGSLVPDLLSGSASNVRLDRSTATVGVDALRVGARQDVPSAGRYVIGGGEYQESPENSEFLNDVLNRVNERMTSAGHRIELNVDQSTGQVVVVFREMEGGKVLMQIPSNESINLAERLEKLTGIFLHKTG